MNGTNTPSTEDKSYEMWEIENTTMSWLLYSKWSNINWVYFLPPTAKNI